MIDETILSLLTVIIVMMIDLERRVARLETLINNIANQGKSEGGKKC